MNCRISCPYASLPFCFATRLLRTLSRGSSQMSTHAHLSAVKSTLLRGVLSLQCSTARSIEGRESSFLFPVTDKSSDNSVAECTHSRRKVRQPPATHHLLYAVSSTCNSHRCKVVLFESGQHPWQRAVGCCGILEIEFKALHDARRRHVSKPAHQRKQHRHTHHSVRLHRTSTSVSQA